MSKILVSKANYEFYKQYVSEENLVLVEPLPTPPKTDKSKHYMKFQKGKR